VSWAGPEAGARRALARARGRACCIAAAAAPLGSSLPTMAAPSPSGGGGTGGGSGSGTPGPVGSPAPGHPAVSSMQGKEDGRAETPVPSCGGRCRRGLAERPRTPTDPAKEATRAARASRSPSLPPSFRPGFSPLRCRPPRVLPGPGLRPTQAPIAASARARPCPAPRRPSGPTWPGTAPVAVPFAPTAYLAPVRPSFPGLRRAGAAAGGPRSRPCGHAGRWRRRRRPSPAPLGPAAAAAAVGPAQGHLGSRQGTAGTRQPS
jgi:hypothetical protein